MTIDQLLSYLAGAGAVAVAGWFISWVIEPWQVWQNWNNPNGKRLVILALALVIGAVAQAMKSLDPATLAIVAPYVETAILVISAWLASQAAHKINKAV